MSDYRLRSPWDRMAPEPLTKEQLEDIAARQGQYRPVAVDAVALAEIRQLRAELATAHRRIEHLTARMRYWRTQATGYPDSRQQIEARRKG